MSIKPQAWQTTGDCPYSFKFYDTKISISFQHQDTVDLKMHPQLEPSFFAGEKRKELRKERGENPLCYHRKHDNLCL